MLRMAAAGAGFLLFASTTSPPRMNHLQRYPHLAGQVLFENHRVVVQRFVVQPGQWEGVHAHPGNQLYVHIRGGEWTVRNGATKETSIAEDGEVGWMDAVPQTQDHESGNTGSTPIDFLWITLKD